MNVFENILYPPTPTPLQVAEDRITALSVMLGRTLAIVESSMEAGGIIGDLKQEVPGLREWWKANRERFEKP